MPGWFGGWELLILLAVLVLVFGSRRLPELGRSLGKGIREFKESVSGRDRAERPALPAPEEDELRVVSEGEDVEDRARGRPGKHRPGNTIS